ncbi:MAG: HEAT repeat domain-containing protein, partial [Gemmatimonadetes bacterium]|nr:HEAT repeat domain-containing protein [Gemmatimonadota bacterium]
MGFASFNAAAWLAWLYVYGYTGLLAGRALDHPLIGALAGVAVGLPVSVALGTGAHYGSPVGLLGIPFAIVLAITGKLWLGLACSAVPLAAVLGDRSARSRAERRLGKIGEALDPADVATLTDQYLFLSESDASGSEQLKTNAVAALAARANDAVREVIARYGKTRSRRHKALLIALLGDLRHPSATLFLGDLLRTANDVKLLGAAVHAAANASDPLLVPPLVDIVRRHEDQDLRSRAARALGRIKGPEAHAAILHVVRGHIEEGAETPSGLLEAAVEACGMAGWDDCVPLLVRMIRGREYDHGVRFESTRALGRMGSAAAVDAMKALAAEQEYGYLLRWALEALGTEVAQREVP